MEMVTGSDQQLDEDYARVEQAIHFLEGNFLSQPALKDVAESAGLSEFHFQRLFTRWVGISPKRFLQYLTKEYAKNLLRQSEDVLNVTYDSGLSSPGRLHDLFVATEAVTPGEYKSRGEGIQIEYGFHATPFGECLLARTNRGICYLAFINSAARDRSSEKDAPQADEAVLRSQALAQLRLRWGRAELTENAEATRPLIQQIFWPPAGLRGTLPLYLNGTNFQIKVWEALLRIPSGSVVTYEDIAISIGMPGASRAVGTALANNPIAVIIPCHRVIHKNGDFGHYHWGAARKKALLGWEIARQETAAQPADYSI